nr:MAG TPA: chitin synthase regulator [Caudoviricetes sp.]
METYSFSVEKGSCLAVFPLVFVTFSFFLIWLSIKKRRIPGLNIG